MTHYSSLSNPFRIDPAAHRYAHSPLPVATATLAVFAEKVSNSTAASTTELKHPYNHFLNFLHKSLKVIHLMAELSYCTI